MGVINDTVLRERAEERRATLLHAAPSWESTPARQVSSFALRVKRGIDVVVASVTLVFGAPLFLYVAWRIKRESPGPVFFRQVRLGKDMQEFTILKFRTMMVDIDDSVHREFIRESMNGRLPGHENGLHKLEWDRRVTRFGRWLRKTSIDELPQLVNVLRGEMSLVGPRPCLHYEVEHFEPHHFERFLVPAGMTGLWQVTYRARASFREALELDVDYARRFSLRLDLRILLATPMQVIRQDHTA